MVISLAALVELEHDTTKKQNAVSAALLATGNRLFCPEIATTTRRVSTNCVTSTICFCAKLLNAGAVPNEGRGEKTTDFPQGLV